MSLRRRRDSAFAIERLHPVAGTVAILTIMTFRLCAVQVPELAAGAANITLLGLNMRDGLKMKGWLRSKLARSPT